MPVAKPGKTLNKVEVLAEINKARARAGARIIEPKVRKCICCGEEFEAMKYHTCPTCRYKQTVQGNNAWD